MEIAFGKGTTDSLEGSVVDVIDPKLEDSGSPMYSIIGSS